MYYLTPLFPKSDQQLTSPNNTNGSPSIEVMRIKKMITKGELRPVLKQFLPTSTVRNALGQIRRICMLILGNKGLRNKKHFLYFHTVIETQVEVLEN